MYFTWKELIIELKMPYKRLKRFIQANFDENEVAWPKDGRRKTIFTAKERDLIKSRLQ